MEGGEGVGEKDIAEKKLLAYADVFANILNVGLFGGDEVIHSEELTDVSPQSTYKVKGKLREQERDVAKLWKDKDYQAIVSMAERLPEETIQEDSNLLMYYDISLSRV